MSFLSLSSLLLLISGVSAVPDIVNFTSGAVLGNRIGNVRQFFAVPFAASTDASNSWMPPQPREPWDFVMDCTTWGAGCFSSHHNPDVPKNQSFDCLNVNIFAPASSGSALPVMVFFNGGAFLEGSNQGPFGIYNGSYIAEMQGVIVVAANYRLGAFGNLASGKEDINGSFGLMDQVAALQWVQDNIAAVGGDKKAVTVFGESAGAMSIGLLLTTSHAEGLFSKAIMESNVAGFNYKNLSEAAVFAETFCGLLNCSNCERACLINAAPSAIENAWDTATGNIGDWILTNLKHILDGLLGTGPTRDGSYVPMEPMDAVEGGTYWGRNVPLMLGTNTNEGETFVYAGVDFVLPPFLAEAAYFAIFEDANTTAAVEAQPRYHYQNFDDARTPLSNVVTDYWFRCASEVFLKGAYAAGTTNVFAYRYNHLYSNASIFPSFGLPPICAEVVCHASELPFVFHNVPNFTSFTPQESVLSNAMATAWANFAKTGNPNGGAAPVWPAWTPSARTTLVLNETFTTESTLGLCGFWDSVGSYFA